MGSDGERNRQEPPDLRTGNGCCALIRPETGNGRGGERFTERARHEVRAEVAKRQAQEC
jgi:hypothetical protein